MAHRVQSLVVARARVKRALIATAGALALAAAAPGGAHAAGALPKVAPVPTCAGVVNLPAAERSELIALSDPARLTGLRDAEVKVQRIAQILSARRDRRGIFPVFYARILGSAVPELESGTFEYDDWANAVSLSFYRRYAENLHAHLTGRSVTPSWAHFYKLAADCRVSPGRVAMAALDAHLVIDFPQSVAETKTQVKHTADYFAIGDLLRGETIGVADDLQRIYGTNLAPFFQLYFFGDKLDAITGEGVTTTLLFQGIRGVALVNGLALQKPLQRLTTLLGMNGLWLLAEGVSDALGKNNLL